MSSKLCSNIGKNAENQGHSSIMLEMYKQYTDELRTKRATNLKL